MKKLALFILLATGLISTQARAQAMETDDTILVEQIKVAVQQYRNVIKDLEDLRTSLQQDPAVGDEVMSNPKMTEFLHVSYEPAQREVTRLFQRYQKEYGARAFQKLSKRYGFSDVQRP